MNTNEAEDLLRWKEVKNGSSRMFRLQQRQEILSVIREDLYSQNYLEVETPIIVKNTTPDTYIESIKVGENYLITSTEYQVKRLIAGGFSQVFTLTKNFRRNDQGRYHSSEFTMLEWGGVFKTLTTIEQEAVHFIQKAFQKIYPGSTTIHFNGYEIDLMATSWEKLTVREAFKTYLGLENLGDFSLDFLCKAALHSKIDIPHDFQNTQALVISYLLDLLQSHLGKKTPTFLHEWPNYLTSSAPLNETDPYIAERSELYIGGIEIANGFPFLRNSQKQKEFFEQELLNRNQQKKDPVKIDEKYIYSLKDLPEGAGMALGIDRLVMVLTNATSLSDVQAFTWDEL